MILPRLDILIYAHDGRGLGHASRSTAIGMALRRMFPDKKVLFVSGCKMTASLIGNAPLDWIKLPSYETRVVDGKSKGIAGNSNFSLKELGRYRAETIRQLVTDYRPRVVLVDHQPQGKQKELLPSIEATQGTDTHWVLGVRGVVGGVPQVYSELARTVFDSRFKDLFWYGDAHVLGSEPKDALAAHFNVPPEETGYVSRLGELIHWLPGAVDPKSPLANRSGGTVSIPWIGEDTLAAISKIAEALRRIGDRFGFWRLFIGAKTPSEAGLITEAFKDMPFCRLEPPSDLYAEALVNSRFALIYGGYNSIIDVLQIGTPAVVLMRGMHDNEQQEHLRRLNEAARAGLSIFSEAALTADILKDAIEHQLFVSSQRKEINLKGAENTACRIVELIEK